MRDRPVLGNLSPLIPAGDDVEATLAFYARQLGFTTILAPWPGPTSAPGSSSRSSTPTSSWAGKMASVRM
jgi:hypothetical protein